MQAVKLSFKALIYQAGTQPSGASGTTLFQLFESSFWLAVQHSRRIHDLSAISLHFLPTYSHNQQAKDSQQSSHKPCFQSTLQTSAVSE